MTLNELYKNGISELNVNNIDDAEFDARCLLEFAFGIDTTQFFLKRSEDVSEEDVSVYHSLIKRRSEGEPLQYILEKWEFMSNEFFVGQGVLIPRPETEKLVELAVEYLQNISNPVVIDLCSGSGCVAISIAKLLPEVRVYAVEKYEKAFKYLERNIAYNKVSNVTAINGDMFDKNVVRGVSPKLIVSNPPYIKKSDIIYLSEEVRREPVTALDGGEDGYDFYRFLSDYWLNEILPESSAIMVECAEDQGDFISELFSKYALKTDIVYDFNGLQRIVTAYK